MVSLVFQTRDMVRMIKELFGRRTKWYFIMAVGLTSIVGLIIEKTLANRFDGHPELFAALLILNGLTICLVGWKTRPGRRQISDLSLIAFLILGIVQGIAVLPGVSRLGMTLGTGLVLGLGWTDALILSFSLTLPTIFIANLYSLVLRGSWVEFILRYFVEPSRGIWTFRHEFVSTGLLIQTLVLIAITLISFAAGWWGITQLSQFTGRRLLIFFGLYCAVAGSLQWIFLGLP